MDWWTGMSSSSSSSPCTNGNPNQMMADQMNQMDVNSMFDPWLNCDDLDLGTILHQTNNNNHIATIIPPNQATICSLEHQQTNGSPTNVQQNQALFSSSSSSSSSSSPAISSSNLHSTIMIPSPADIIDQNNSAMAFNRHVASPERPNFAKSSMASEILNNLTSSKQSIFKRINSSNQAAISSSSCSSPLQQQSIDGHNDNQTRHPRNQQQHQPQLSRSLHCSSTSTTTSPISSVDSSPPTNNNNNNDNSNSCLPSPNASSSPHLITSGSSSKSQHGHHNAVIQSNIKQTTILQHINQTNQSESHHMSQSYVDYCPAANNHQLYDDHHHHLQSQQLQHYESQLDSKSNLENLIQASGDHHNQSAFHESQAENHAVPNSRQQHTTNYVSILSTANGTSLLDTNNNNNNELSGSNVLPSMGSTGPSRQTTAKSKMPSRGNASKTNQQNSSRQQQQQLQRQAHGTATTNQKGQKIRRCRHITDYVLADEEKRLLIKEGHTDFPMICQSRPLSKSEERILRKIRRKIRNKKSAQCSRQRKKEYVEELERKYAAVIRENEELKQILDRVQETQQQQQQQSQQQQQQQLQQSNNRHLHQHHHHQHQHRHQQQQQQTVLSESVELDWKDLFPNSIKIVQQSNVYD